MDDFELAQQIAKSLIDAENNDNAALATELHTALAEVNARLVADGFAPVEI